MRVSTQHVRTIVFVLFIAFSILRGFLTFASVKMPQKKRKGRVRFRHQNRKQKRNRRASLTKNGPQNWQRVTKAHFIGKRSGSRSWIFRKAKMLQLLRVLAAACSESLFLLHVTCQTPIVRENWSLSDINQNKHLGVIISFQVGCRQKCIFYFISERKFCRSTRTFKLQVGSLSINRPYHGFRRHFDG